MNVHDKLAAQVAAEVDVRRPQASRRWVRLGSSTVILTLLSVASTFALDKGCFYGPNNGSSFVFSGTAGNSAVNITFEGVRRVGATSVRVQVGKISAANTLSNPVTIATISTFNNCQPGDPVPCDKFKQTVSVRRDGKTSGTAGTVLWKNDDVIGFRMQESVNGSFVTMNSYTAAANENPANGIAAVSDRPGTASFPPNTTGCSTATPPASGKFACPEPSSTFPNQGTANFLARAGQGTSANATAYYNELPSAERFAGATGFADFKSVNGFSSSATACKTSTLTETCAWYRNENDLGFGRQMHCRAVTVQPATGFPTKIACYVSNYKNEEDAFTNTGILATVAMTWNATPRTSGVQDYVKFYVFNGAGARINNIALDGGGDQKFVPELCINCHGGRRSGNRVEGARFLPFDAATLPLASGRPDQTAPLRALNAGVVFAEATYVRNATQTPAQELIRGWYENDLTNGDFHPGYAPPAWNGERSLYLSVVAPYCRSCHIARDGFVGSALSWNTHSSFNSLKGLILADVCSARDGQTMPHAERTHQRFWESGAPAVLAAEFGPLSATDTCAFKPLTTDNTF